MQLVRTMEQLLYSRRRGGGTKQWSCHIPHDGVFLIPISIGAHADIYINCSKTKSRTSCDKSNCTSYMHMNSVSRNYSDMHGFMGLKFNY
jgi:hypothetical protein